MDLRTRSLATLVIALCGCAGGLLPEDGAARDAVAAERPDPADVPSPPEDAPGPLPALDASPPPDDASPTDASASPTDAPPTDAPPPPPDAATACGADTPWRCAGAARTRCLARRVVTEPCARGCLAPATASGDARCIEPDPAWACASSDYRGAQFWTCDTARRAVHRCDASGAPVMVRCEAGCELGPAGTHDACLEPLRPGEAIAAPRVTFVIGGRLFAESAVRGPVETGVRYMLDRYARYVGPTTRRVPDITVRYSASGNPYCSGIAYASSTDIACPPGYPVTGDNQNFVVNITLHEIGHIIASSLISAPSTRDVCVGEGFASWIAGRYWMNYASSPLPSLREAARRVIAAGSASASMTRCVSASDAWYKVYASYFEYLQEMPGAVFAVTSGTRPSSTYATGWATWLR